MGASDDVPRRLAGEVGAAPLLECALVEQTIGLSFIVNRPKMEPGFRLDRAELNDRHPSYTMHSYAAVDPHGARYQGNGSGPEPD